jgi:hypothetical protein
MAFAAANARGLVVLDLSDPNRPTKVAELKMPGPALGIDLYGSFAAVACSNSGIAVVDISDPVNPQLVGTLPHIGRAQSVAVSESGVGIVSAGEELQTTVVDLRDPKNPTRVRNNGIALTVSTVGNAFLIMDPTATGFELLRINDPAVPVVLGSHALTGLDSKYFVGARDGLAVFNGQVCEIVDIHDPSSMSRIGVPFGSRGAGLAGDLIFGPSVFDVSIPSQPAAVGSFGSQVLRDTAKYNGYVFARFNGRLLCIEAPDQQPLLVETAEDPVLHVFNDWRWGMEPNVDARSAWPVSYQWYYGNSPNTGQPLAGRTNAWLGWSLELQRNNVQQFCVRVTNKKGSVDSQPFTVRLEPTVTTRATPRAVGFELAAPRGGTLLIEQSSDLLNWSVDRSVELPGDASPVQVDLPILTSGSRFFRVARGAE